MKQYVLPFTLIFIIATNTPLESNSQSFEDLNKRIKEQQQTKQKAIEKEKLRFGNIKELKKSYPKEKTIVIKPGAGGHYYLNAMVNKVETRFLIDTGATGILLSMSAAKKIGFDLNTLNYSVKALTANGETRIAPVTLDSFEVGTFNATNMPAMVSRINMSESLLGMTFLRRLKGYEVKEGTLTLWP